MSKITSRNPRPRSRGYRLRGFKFTFPTGHASFVQLSAALSSFETTEEFAAVIHSREKAAPHVQGWFATTTPLTEREGMRRIESAGVPRDLIELKPLVGRGAREAFTSYLTHVDEPGTTYARAEFVVSDEGIWSRVDEWRGIRDRRDRRSGREWSVDRIKRELVLNAITPEEVVKRFPAALSKIKRDEMESLYYRRESAESHFERERERSRLGERYSELLRTGRQDEARSIQLRAIGEGWHLASYVPEDRAA